MTVQELIDESNRLVEVANKIQNFGSIGLSAAEMKKFSDDYENWYSECQQILPQQLRTEFEETSKEIHSFVFEPTARVALNYVPDVIAGGRKNPYWKYPFISNFQGPMMKLRSVLSRVSKTPNVISPANNTSISHQGSITDDAIQKVEHIANRLHRVAEHLKKRRKDKGITRSTIVIGDEYDVQELFQSLLQIDFEDIRPEETMPSYAGAHGRVDTYLANEHLFVEYKMTRKGLGKKEVREQILIDIAYYPQHPDCKALVAIIYDPDRYIDNPVGFMKDLSGDHKHQGKEIKVQVIIVQH